MISRMDYTIGICAYNEEQDIGAVLASLLQHETGHNLQEILVVASGCTDATTTIVEDCAQIDNRIVLIVEPERRGKVSAVNKILQRCRTPVLVMTDADCLLCPGAIDRLLDDLTEGVGAVSGRPVPLNDPESGFYGYVAHLRYELYHREAQRRDERKEYRHLSGYLYALRTGIVHSLPPVMLDDITVGLTVAASGHRVRYEPRATVSIVHPTALRDLVHQRYRTRLGHAQIRRQMGYRVPTTRPLSMLLLALRTERWTPRKVLYAVGAAAIEQFVAFRAAWAVRFREVPSTWTAIHSSKNLAAYGHK